MSTFSTNLYGPYKKYEHRVNLPYIAYLIEQKSNDAGFKICLIAHEDQQKVLRNIVSNSIDDVVSAVCTKASNEFQNWQEISCYVGIIEKNGEEEYTLSLSGYQTDKSDPLELVREVIMTLTIVYYKTIEGKEYKITQYAGDLEDRLYTYRVQSIDKDVGRDIHAKNLEELITMVPLMGGMEKSIDAGLYFFETLLYLQANNLNAAFYSFYYASQFYNSSEVGSVIDLGMTLANTMLAKGKYDYADWVTNKIADIASNNALWDTYSRVMRLAGISASTMGRISDVKRYFSKAAEHLNLVSDLDISILVHMSYGLAIVEQFAHWEVEKCYVSEQDGLKAQSNSLKEILETATLHLKLAKDLIGSSRDDRSKQRLCAIELDLIRVNDLSGESTAALKDLESYFHSRKFIHTDKLVSTAILYRTLILKKLNDFEVVSRFEYLDALNQGLQELANLELLPGDRFWCFLTLIGDAFIEQQQFAEALAMFEKAFAIREEKLGEILRVPHPGNDFSGLPLIDVAGRIQLAYMLLAHQKEDATYLWDAMHLADRVKGKIFRRNLAMSVGTNDPDLKSLLSAHYSAIKKNLLSSHQDHRIIIAEYTRFLEQDLSPEQASIFNEANAAYELGVEKEELSELLHSDEHNTAYLSLYATKNQTYFYLLSKPTNSSGLFHLEAFSLNISLDFLTTVFQYLYAGIHGRGNYNPIKAHDPYKKDKKYFSNLTELQKKLEPLVSNLLKFDHIVVSPHGIWHKLPIHVLMLPTFWANELNPGITYVPSIHALNLLKRRASAKRLFSHQLVGLATVRAVEEETVEQEFAEAHSVLKSILSRTKRRVVDFYGCEATPETVLDTLHKAQLMHILAHGSHDVEGNSIKSRLHLAGEFGLPCKPAPLVLGGDKGYRDEEVLSGDAMMMSGTSAEHVTLQSCSLGRFETAFGDELWGMGRALLAGGADSVLLAMWNVDRVSSTAIISSFYENWLIHKLPKWKALANAQLEIYKNQQNLSWSHFYHWGALQLIGV